MKQLFYYAYGSNLLSKRLTARIGNAEFIRNHTLNNYQLMFNCGGFANIEPIVGASVEGSLYAIESWQLKELSRYEGFYTMEFFDIPEGLAVVFVGDIDIVRRSMYSGSKSDPAYIDIVLAGMAEKGLDISYRNLERIRDVIEEKPIIRSGKRSNKKSKHLRKVVRF